MSDSRKENEAPKAEERVVALKLSNKKMAQTVGGAAPLGAPGSGPHIPVVRV